MTRMFSDALSSFHFWSWQAIIVAAALTLPFGSMVLSSVYNSVGIGLITTVLAVALATPAAYALARLRFRGKALVLPLTLAVAVFPPMALVAPLFDLWRALGLYDTWPGLVIPYLSFALPETTTTER